MAIYFSLELRDILTNDRRFVAELLVPAASHSRHSLLQVAESLDCDVERNKFNEKLHISHQWTVIVQ